MCFLVRQLNVQLMQVFVTASKNSFRPRSVYSELLGYGLFT